MSKLIDTFLKESHNAYSGNDGYMLKPLPMYTIQEKLKRIKDAIRILRRKSFAIHYKVDSIEKKQ